MHIEVVTEEGRQVVEPFLVRLGGWTEERYLAEAPEDRLLRHDYRATGWDISTSVDANGDGTPDEGGRR